jgi:hypothetical protein
METPFVKFRELGGKDRQCGGILPILNSLII